MTHKLKIDWDELALAFQTSSMDMLEVRSFLDLETGEVVSISREAYDYLEEEPGYELPEWMQEEVKKTEQIEEGYPKRYVRIPGSETHEDYRDMERFTTTVENDRLRERLWQAIPGRGAFRYFKDVLAEHPAERERWFTFSDRCLYERISWWLESEDIEPTNPIELPEVAESEAIDKESHEALLENLTFLVIYLSSWEETLTPHRPPGLEGIPF